MNLRIKLFGPLIIFTSLLAGYLTLYWLPNNTQQFINGLKFRLSEHINDVSDSLVPSLLSNDLATIHETLSSLLEKNPTWTQVILFNVDGQRIFPLNEPVTSSRHTHEITQPVTYRDTVIGNIHLHTDLSVDLENIIHEQKTLSFAIIIGLSVFLLITVIIVELLVRRPIALLVMASDKIRGGDFNIRLPYSSKDEIGKLVSHFISMKDAVVDTQKRLRIKSLEFSEVLDKTTDAYFTLDDEWKFTYLNRQTLNLFNTNKSALIGEVIWDVLSEFSSSFYKLFHRAKAGSIPVKGEGYYPPLDKWLEANIYRLDNGYAIYLRDITERRAAEKQLFESEHLNHTILDNAADGIMTVDPRGLINTFNKSAENIFGYQESEVKGKSINILLPEELSDEGSNYLSRYAQINSATITSSGKTFELQGKRKDGGLFPMDIAVSDMSTGGKHLFIVTMRDISERKKQEEGLLLANQVFESSIDGIIITDANNRILRVNRAFTIITGYRENEIIGQTPALLSSGAHGHNFYKNMWSSLIDKGYWQGEILNKRKDGSEYPEYLSISTVRDADGKIAHHIGVFTDISEKKKAEDAIQRLANHDPLTGLVNRRVFNDRLHQALIHANRHGYQVAVLYIDLDRFKNINDTLGHPTGDLLLKNIADRLQECLRDEDTASRIGGDEFIIMLPDIDSQQAVSIVTRKIMHSLKSPHTIDGREMFTTASIGIALYPKDAEDVDDLIKNADTALYHAKENGRNTYQFYRREMSASSLELFTLESDLRRALERNEFILHYQPQMELETGRIVGAESLVRWQHEKFGLISPGTFIPLLEETGLIIPVGEWIMRTACEQNRLWQEAGLPPLRIAVNISPLQIKQSDLVAIVGQVLKETGLEPQWLELEITESSIMGNAEKNIETLNRLKSMGIHLAIDDFGTGYSSLSYLKRFPIDVLKIDQSFVRDIMTDMDDAAITNAVIALGHSLDLKIIAEGVEDREQQEFLYSRQCDIVQGY